jgi:hypothetical protein
MTMCQLIAKTTLASLLSGLAVIIIAVLLNSRFTGKSLYEILLGRIKIIVSSLALLILLMPAVVSLLRGAWLSPEELALYVRELLVSVVTVVSFGVTWKVLSALDLWTYFQMNRDQIVSLTKILEGDSTGRHELREDVQFGEGLRLVLYLVARMALWWTSNAKYQKELRLVLSYQRV